MSSKTLATITDLYTVEGKAELVHGEIVSMAPTGDDPGFASLKVAARLLTYTEQTRRGRAYGDGVGFHVQLPHRESFSPDAAYHVGPRTGMRFLEGAPTFAVEIRSASDYGPAAERDMAARRADYFACGTLRTVPRITLPEVRVGGMQGYEVDTQVLTNPDGQCLRDHRTKNPCGQ